MTAAAVFIGIVILCVGIVVGVLATLAVHARATEPDDALMSTDSYIRLDRDMAALGSGRFSRN